MFVIDLNQVMLSNFFASVGRHTNIEIDESLMRHMILNTLRAINVKFRKEWGEMVIASDSLKSWRRDEFPYYKAARRKGRAKSDMDWKAIFSAMDQVKAELQEYFPYRFIQVDGAEADDVIAMLAMQHKDAKQKLLIVSGDKDFRQLQNEYVKQYDPVAKKWITERDPEGYLEKHILEGDVGDGIPNVLSDDDVFVDDDKRQSPLTAKKRKLFEVPLMIEDDKYKRNYHRNKRLIDLTEVPRDIQSKILEAYEKGPKVSDRSLLLGYFSQNRLRTLTEKLSDF